LALLRGRQLIACYFMWQPGIPRPSSAKVPWAVSGEQVRTDTLTPPSEQIPAPQQQAL
jgi:hypothetical protein